MVYPAGIPPALYLTYRRCSLIPATGVRAAVILVLRYIPGFQETRINQIQKVPVAFWDTHQDFFDIHRDSVDLSSFVFVGNTTEKILCGDRIRCKEYRGQAEDGIRDISVTGVQTCALPIYSSHTDISYAVFCLDRKSVV